MLAKQDTDWFYKWQSSDEAIRHREIIASEKKEVRELMKRLSKMDRNSEEFVDLVLYGLLPYYETKFAKRISTFPVFLNIKPFFRRYNYSEKEWALIANRIFSLAENFQREPEKLEKWIEEFTSDGIYSRSLQCGSITPILFCIDDSDSFPLINNKVIDTYKIFADKLDWGDTISQKLENYMDNIPKCKKLIDYLDIKGMDNELFDLFCWQYSTKASQKADRVKKDKEKTITVSPSTKTQNPTKKYFVPIDSWEFVQQRIHQLPPPNLQSIDSIVKNIQDGKYTIPVFQREYTWTRKQIEELWESIFQGFFVGSILTWDYDNQVDTMSVQGAPTPKNPTDIILDGQQRITSLFHAVADPKLADNKNVFFVDLKALLDPDSDTTDIVFSESKDRAKKLGYLEKDKQFAKKIFPLTQFYRRDYTLWVGEFKTYMESENQCPNPGEYYSQILDILDHVWFKYVIPVVQLPRSLSLDSVAEIFEKINSTGTRLGVFDLLNARFTKYGVDLRDLWSKARANYAEIQDMDENFRDADKYTLQALCLFKKRYTRRRELLTLDDAYKRSKTFQKDEFQREWSDICRYVSAAIAKLKSHREDGFGAVALWMTPYTVIVPILAALLYAVEGRVDMPKCMGKIQNWYWSVVTSDSYSGSVDTKIERDYRELLLWFDDDMAMPRIVAEQREDIASLEINTTKTNDSIYNTVVCLIAKMGANDFLTDRTPEYSTLDDHHIFPKSLASQYPSTININSILNRTVLDSNTNRKFLRDKTPAKYIREIIKEQQIGEQVMRKRLKTHLISDKAFDCLLNDDFDGFVHARAETIRAELHKLVIPSDELDDTRLSLLHSVESKRLEYKSSLRWDLKLETINPSLEEAVSKELCAFMNSGGGDLLIGVDDNGQPIGLDKDYATLRIKNYDGFVQHITNMINKYLGKISNTYIEFEQIQVDGTEICLCRVLQAQSPVFLNKDGMKKFFIRANNTCQPLDAEEAYQYITQHWD